MMKECYSVPELEIVCFGFDDVVKCTPKGKARMIDFCKALFAASSVL